jgi:hypothetical protein
MIRHMLQLTGVTDDVITSPMSLNVTNDPLSNDNISQKNTLISSSRIMKISLQLRLQNIFSK